MVRKGNLLWNGDFETGDKVDWVLNPFNLGTGLSDFVVVTDPAGGYAGNLWVAGGNNEGYIMYDKECDFEECEAFIYLMRIKKFSGRFIEGVLYGLDDNGNYIDFIPFAEVRENNVWKTIKCVLRQYNNFSHFAVGIRGLTLTDDTVCNFRGAKLIPVKHANSVYIGEYIRKDDLSSDFDYYGECACLGRCKFYSIITVPQLSGTDVELTIRISLYTQDWVENLVILEHPTLTEPSCDILSIEMPEVAKYRIQYISGTSPVADIRHDIRIVPL